MKKVTILLVLVAMLASVFGTGAASVNKLIRLDVINDSGDTVYLKLEATVGEAYYYLTIPDGEVMNYTIETDPTSAPPGLAATKPPAAWLRPPTFA
jgi:hypothetical protein